MFQKTHSLNWPIEDDKSQSVNSIVMKTLTMGQHREISKKHKGKETDLLRACISKSTGLSLTEIKRLITPDFNSIQDKVLELMNSTAQPLIEERIEREVEALNETLQSLVSSEAPEHEIDNIKKQIDETVFKSESPELLITFVGDDGQDKTGYKLRPPTVATTDLMEAHEGDWDRTLFISTSCTGFSRDELERMSLPDWNQLQERLIDFLQKPADFFRRETSKS